MDKSSLLILQKKKLPCVQLRIFVKHGIILLIKFSTSDNAFRELWLVSLNLGYQLIYLCLTLYGKMIALSVAKLKMFSSECKISLWIKPKGRKKTFFVESLDQFRRLEVREKGKKCFCDEPASVWQQGITSVLIKFFSISLGFARFFRSYFVLPNFWSWRNLIKQLFHSRLLDMSLVIANSALRASLAIYHLISNARLWNNC